MSSEKSQSSRSKKSKSSGTKFIPNLTQLAEATKGLPDAELWPDETCICPIEVDERLRTIEFKRKQITRGSSKPYRWIYEGKILIRNRDIPEAD
ncbi:MAG: hypothetical protein ACON4O_05605 [Lentimonas sp.]